MTNLELAQQQGNQAAPNLLNAAAAGELGGGGSMFPSLSTAGFVSADISFTLSSDQADEAAANTIYANCKLVTDNHLDFFQLTEIYTSVSEGSEVSVEFLYYAFSERALARIKNFAAFAPEIQAEIREILDTIEPDELCTFDSEAINEALVTLTMESVVQSIDELPPSTSGVIELGISDELTPFSVPAGSWVYLLAMIPGVSSGIPLTTCSYYAESLLDTPIKLDNTYYAYLFGSESESELESEPEP